MSDCLYEATLSVCIKNLDNFQNEIFLWITFVIQIFYPQVYTDRKTERSRLVLQEKKSKKKPGKAGLGRISLMFRVWWYRAF